MNAAILTLSALTFVTSAATLTIVIVGGKRMQAEMDETKTKANKALGNVRKIVNGLEF